MSGIAEWLSGRKTYIGVIASAIYLVLIQAGVVPSNEAVWGAIVLWTGVSLRASIKKV